MTSEDDCFNKLPTLNNALKLEGLPIEIDFHLKPRLFLPQEREKQPEQVGEEGLSLPPLALSRLDSQTTVEFKVKISTF